MREEYVRTLVEAHYASDEARFQLTVQQLASHVRDPLRREAFRALADRMVMLPAEAKSRVVPVAPVALEDLVLTDALAAELRTLAREHRHATALQARGLPPRNRLLFWGPPGNGKTSAAAALAGLVSGSAFAGHFPALVSQYLGETGANLHKAFGVLTAGCTLVLDEIDALGASRVDSTHASGREYNTVVSTLLTLMDREQGGILVATTNRPDTLDPALRRRFSCELEFPAPDALLLGRCADALCKRYGVPGCDTNGAASFDALTKRVQAHARAIVLTQLESET